MPADPAPDAAPVSRAPIPVPERLQARRNAFETAYRRITNNVTSPESMAGLVRYGWTVDLLDRLDALAGAALKAKTPLATWAQGRRNIHWEPRQAIASLLADHIEHCANGRTPDYLLPWAVIAAHTRSPAVLFDVLGEAPLDVGPVSEQVAWATRVTPDARTIIAWTWITTPRLAPIAYAAGLTYAEARTGYEQHTLDEVTLRSMAALRGIPLP